MYIISVSYWQMLRTLKMYLRFGIWPLEIEVSGYTPIYDNLTKKNRRRHPSEMLCKLYKMGLCEN